MTPDQLFEAVEATWPAAATRRVGPWRVRDGQGGGKRVSAVSAEGDWAVEDIALAEAICMNLGQDKLFQLRPEEAELDKALELRGYEVLDPVDLLACSVEHLTAEIHRLAAIPCWPPLAMQAEIWAEGGIGPARLDVMTRAEGPKTALLGRHDNKGIATAYVACHGPIAMLHALEVAPEARRQGVGHVMMHGAANWAARNGARDLAVLVVKDNKPAQSLYASLGMMPVGQYHYRIKRS